MTEPDLERALHDELRGLDDLTLDEAQVARLTAAGRRAQRRARGRRLVGGATAVASSLALVALVGALLVASPADEPAAERTWTVADLLPWGDYHFVDFDEIRGGGETYQTTPRYADLPPHPSVVFPAGVGYRDALDRFTRARNAGAALPEGAEIGPPLPAGRVVLVRDDGRIALDSAAPEGYALATGRLSGSAIGNVRGPAAPPLPRCQVLLGPEDAPPACTIAPDAPVAAIVEAAPGWWEPVPPAPALMPVTPAERSAVRLSVFDAPPLQEVEIPPVIRETAARANSAPEEFRTCGRLELSSVRRGAATGNGGRRVYVASDGGDRLWLFNVLGDSTGSTCFGRDDLVRRGIVTIASGTPGDTRAVAGLVPDDVTGVRAGDVGAEVRDNLFLLEGVAPGAGVSLRRG